LKGKLLKAIYETRRELRQFSVQHLYLCSPFDYCDIQSIGTKLITSLLTAV